MNCKRKCKGDCCKVMFLPLFNRDHALWAHYHGLEVYQVEGKEEYKVKIERECKMLKDNKCMVYEDRPQMCRDYWCDKAPKMKRLWN